MKEKFSVSKKVKIIGGLAVVALFVAIVVFLPLITFFYEGFSASSASAKCMKQNSIADYDVDLPDLGLINVEKEIHSFPDTEREVYSITTEDIEQIKAIEQYVGNHDIFFTKQCFYPNLKWYPMPSGYSGSLFGLSYIYDRVDRVSVRVNHWWNDEQQKNAQKPIAKKVHFSIWIDKRKN